MSRFIGALVAFAVCVFTLGCDSSNRVLSLPTSPSGGTSAAPVPTPTPAPTPTPIPQPRPLPSVAFTEITVGQTVTSVVPTPAPPCAGEPQWPCQYFRFTAPSDGLVTVELRYRPETQPPGRFGLQGVDISVVDASGREVWADFFSPSGVTGARVNVKEGVIYQITLWYTYPSLEYELETALHR
jgi:hypothetical protein